MPVKNNIAGIWRHLQLINAGEVFTDITSTGQVYGVGASTRLDEITLIVDSAGFKSKQEVNPQAMLQGTAFTKVVEIGKASDELNVKGPMLFTESDENTVVNDPLNLFKTHPAYGDASQVVAAYLGEALNIGTGTLKPTFVNQINMTMDSSGFSFDVNLKGDPTSLYPKFFDVSTGNTIPLGHPTPLNTAIRKASWYDFYLPITVKPVIGTTGTGATVNTGGVTLAAAIESWTGNIQIAADEITLIGRGQAPWYSINQVSMSGTFTAVFPLLPEPNGDGTYQTVVPTWQAVPYPWNAENPGPYDGTGFGSRDIIDAPEPRDPVPTNNFGDRPDVFTISSVGVIPRYVINTEQVLSDIDETQAIVIKDVDVQVNSGIIKANVGYEVIFSDA